MPQGGELAFGADPAGDEGKEGRLGHVPTRRRGDDPGAAALCPRADPGRRPRRRSGAGHAGAGAALGASVPWWRIAQLAVHDPHQPQPQSAALAARRPMHASLEDNDAPDMAGPEAGGRDIERALATLVEDQRNALLLVVLEGLSYRE